MRLLWRIQQAGTQMVRQIIIHYITRSRLLLGELVTNIGTTTSQTIRFSLYILRCVVHRDHLAQSATAWQKTNSQPTCRRTGGGALVGVFHFYTPFGTCAALAHSLGCSYWYTPAFTAWISTPNDIGLYIYSFYWGLVRWGFIERVAFCIRVWLNIYSLYGTSNFSTSSNINM